MVPMVVKLMLSLLAILGIALIFTEAVRILCERLDVRPGTVGSMPRVCAQDPAFSGSAHYRRSFYSEEEE